MPVKTLASPLRALALALAVAAPASGQVLRVPQDVGNLQNAIGQVADGGIIQIAAGTYVAPPNGFRISNLRKGFTLRAAPGAEVVLTGGSDHPILRFENGNPSRGGRVFFRGLTFRDGFSGVERIGGAVTLVAADGAFIGCQFEGSVSSAPTTGGGAALIHGGSLAVFVGSRFEGNSALNRGGAIEIVDSTVYVHDGQFEGNRVNLPGHAPAAGGGAIYVTDGRLAVSDSRFASNQAAWTGGAILGIGVWTSDERQPAAELSISSSTFEGNTAASDAGSPAPGASGGGAIHVEDQTTLRVFSSLFTGNHTEQGGAINSYRAIVEIADSAFRGNFAEADGADVPIGGAVYLTAADFADSSTDFGAVNRRSGELRAVRTLFQGRFGTVGTAARDGGCLAAGGDLNRHFGTGGVAQDGSVAQNRVRVVLRESIFFDCDVAPDSDGAGAFGGAIHAQLTDLTLTGSLVLNSDSLHGSAGGGGGAAVLLESAATIADTVFAGNRAFRGGGLFVNGSRADVAGSAFIANEVSPGVSEPVAQSRGAAIFSLPNVSPVAGRSTDVEGVVSSTLFAHNVGLPVFDSDRDDAPVNRLRYDGNRFFSTTFGSTVYVNNQAAPNGLSASGLNGLVVQHVGVPAADKSQVGNQSLGSAPAEGKVRIAPIRLSRFGGDGPAKAFVGFAWSGSSATLDGQPVAARSGLVEVGEAKTFRLRVGSALVSEDAVGPDSCSTRGLLCVSGQRFLLDVAWRDFQGRTGIGEAVPLSADTGYFFFFDPANVELISKVLNGTQINGRFWLFYGALSNVEYELRGLDTHTGFLRVYSNPPRQFASVGDTQAFPANAGGATAAALAEPVEAASTLDAELFEPDPTPDKGGPCVPSSINLCLNQGRFHVEMDWTDFQGNSGAGRAVALTGDTGYFFFVNPSNVEVVIKVLNGTALNQHFWVFYGALSNVQYQIRVTDTVTGFRKTYNNPLRNFASVGDTAAIPANP